MGKKDAKNDAVDELLEASSQSSGDCNKKKKRCGCVEPKSFKRNCCNGNNCCGNVACVVAACDACEQACLNNTLNLIVTNRRFIPLSQPGTSSLAATGSAYVTLNYYVQIPKGDCPTGPMSAEWSIPSVIANNFAAANISSLIGSGETTVTIKNILNIETTAPVFNIAKSPATQNNGFGAFGNCVCSSTSLQYTITVVFTVGASSCATVTGTVTVQNSACQFILLAPVTGEALAFSINNCGTVSINILNEDGTFVLDPCGNPRALSPAVKLDFYQSCGENRYFAVVDSSGLNL
ncbi:MAG: hypothetical protein Hyperionvirus9_56 [Hyperionvirus sp.]|uniref:Uncharacterized protein n=1 Tax=Hyperionvirus sp. TaxID=2487770 RepID=A0A3G5AE41_9VIRU|nr:MAG: hypothetical protein Hyperionvirus9_56 [Hyperionvirus sp.]